MSAQSAAAWIRPLFLIIVIVLLGVTIGGLLEYRMFAENFAVLHQAVQATAVRLFDLYFDHSTLIRTCSRADLDPADAGVYIVFKFA